MEVKINKEINDYEEEIFFGLSLKQCIAAIVITAVALTAGLLMSSKGIPLDVIVPAVIVICLPGAFLGFFSYNGMSAWQLMTAFIRSSVLMPRFLPYRAENIYYDLFRSYRREVRPKVRKDRNLRKARSLSPAQEKVCDPADIDLAEPVPQTIDEIMDEQDEEEKARQKERMVMKEQKKKKRRTAARKAGSLLADVLIWVVISLILTYIVNKTDLLSIMGEWIRRIFSSR